MKKDHGEIDRNIRRSCYREALFLLIAAVGSCLQSDSLNLRHVQSESLRHFRSNLDTKKGQKNIEIPLFDDHWFKAHNSLPPHARDLRVLNDQTPSQRVFHVREYFKERDGQPSALPLLH